MINTTITFQGNSYPARVLTIMLNDEPEEVTVSVQSLSDVLMNEDKHVSDEAEQIDNGIYFFIQDDMINLPDAELAKNLDEEFELAPDEEDEE